MFSINVGSGGEGGTGRGCLVGQRIVGGAGGCRRGGTYFEGTASKDLLMELGAMGQR